MAINQTEVARENAARIRAILVRRVAALVAVPQRSEEQNEDLAKLQAAILKIDTVWPPTARA